MGNNFKMLNYKITNRRKEIRLEEQAINISKIKYIDVVGKIYSVTKISFYNMIIEAVATNLTAADVPEDELWDFSEFRDYKVKLINNGGQAEIVDFEEWKAERNNEIRLLSK